ncbi:SGNH/GDSL hydrolase family protein [Agromyces larvae]|uniref:SGNH/GDSL hydrolase family protein n=1 Tax=Agromyces larvae TaxID=2929802 RepID=A0ABY4BYD3_9MICO|nr:SGNH/GDSL hydrolase family protein [Agromyces larvae]UOE44134.1 SGNH/GDSL hydrolase family protein [Agromyces larvae]
MQRRTLAVVASIGGLAGVAVWWRWLARRQRRWTTALAETIPVNSAYWREQRAETDATPGALLYVAIGDSAAQGIGASRPGHSYVGFIARGIAEASGRPVRAVNLGISGATVRMAIEKELPLLDPLEPDVLTVSIGANDIAEFDPQRFDRDIRELISRLPAHAIVADLPSFYFLAAQRKVRLANRMLRAAAAERGLEVVPLHARTDRQGLWGVTTQFAGDLFHPNDRGYRVWAAAFLPAVERRLGVVAEQVG